MPPASASSVRTADAIKARPCSLVGLSLLDGFDFAMGSFRADYRARGGARGTHRTGPAGTVNAPLTISVLASLTKAYRPRVAAAGGLAPGAAAIRTKY